MKQRTQPRPAATPSPPVAAAPPLPVVISDLTLKLPVETHLSRETALSATQSLKERDIISECNEGGELIFRFRILLARLWVLRTQSSARLLLERTVRQ